MIALTAPSLPRTRDAAPRPGVASRALAATGQLLVVTAARLATASAARHERRTRHAAVAAARAAHDRTADDHRRDNAAQVHPLALR